jgi:glyoxylase-like metal-dependent hydrolase (beta-lactamase superfamily II)
MLRFFTAFLILQSFAIAEFRQPLPDVYLWQDTCNVYVLKHNDKALLINLGDGSVLEHLAEIGVKQVEWVLFTDHHREQCQGAPKLDRTLTQIAASKDELAFFETPNEFRKWNPRLGDKFTVHGSSYLRPPGQPVKIDRGLTDGEKFTWHDLTLTCVSTPGHSPGGMSFILKQGEQTVAFTGGVMHEGAKMTNWFDTEWDYGFAKGLDALITSVDKLIALKPDTAFPSQGPVMANATAQLKTHKDKLTQFRPDYVRGYPVESFGKRPQHPATKSTKAHYIVQVTPHLYMFGPEMAGKNFAIIIADSGHALLLDCGLFPKLVLERIISDMQEFLGLKQIDACWISHSHGDHFTLFPALKDHGVQFWTMDTIADKCENPRYYDYPAMIGAYNAGFEQAKIDRILKAGEVIDWEGYKLHIDWMPGQTEFGNALWLELDGKKIVFTGDNLFGDPSDPAQNGHECVNARNSAIIDEGYLVAAQYLQKLQPDIIMGAHGVLMTEPKAFIERYHDWAQRIIREYKELLPDANYEYFYDPYWVSAYPYRVDFQKQVTQEVSITVRNFRDTLQKHSIALQLPPGITADSPVLEGTVPAKSRQSFKVKLTADPAKVPAGVQMVPMDINLDGRRYGQLFDFILQASEPVKNDAK